MAEFDEQINLQQFSKYKSQKIYFQYFLAVIKRVR